MNSTTKTFFILASLLCSFSIKAQNIDYTHYYQGRMDLTRDNNIIVMLSDSMHKTIQQQAIDSIQKKPNDYTPPVLYMLSHVLFELGEKYKASFWFYTGQLRARIDANICLDKTAGNAVSMLNEDFGPEINQYSFQSIDSLKLTIYHVVEFVRNNNESYDHRWINLHGMDAVKSGLGIKDTSIQYSEPMDKWSEIKKQTVDSYYNDFNTYVLKRKN